MAAPPAEISRLLKLWGEGDQNALEQLIPLVYLQLQQLARAYMRREGAGHVLQSTALVHEAYLRLATLAPMDWQDRVHFFAVSAQIMRRILVDAARQRAAAKRGGGAEGGRREAIDLDRLPAHAEAAQEISALDEALVRLAHLDPRRARVVELRFFGGLTVDETADLLHVSARTIAHDWALARAWLMRELQS